MIPNTWLYETNKRKYWIENPNVFVKRNWQRTMRINLGVMASLIVEVEERIDPNSALYFDMTQLLFTITTKEYNATKNRKRPLLYRQGAWSITEEDLQFSNRGIKRKILKPSWIGFRGLLYTLGYFLEWDNGPSQNRSGILIVEGSFKNSHTDLRKATYGK